MTTIVTTTMIASSDWFVSLLLDVSLKAILLAVLAGAGMWLMRVRATSVRHRVWTAVLVGMVMMPLLVAWSPTVPLPTWAYPDLRSGDGQELAVDHEDICTSRDVECSGARAGASPGRGDVECGGRARRYGYWAN